MKFSPSLKFKISAPEVTSEIKFSPPLCHPDGTSKFHHLETPSFHHLRKPNFHTPLGRGENLTEVFASSTQGPIPNIPALLLTRPCDCSHRLDIGALSSLFPLTWGRLPLYSRILLIVPAMTPSPHCHARTFPEGKIGEHFKSELHLKRCFLRIFELFHAGEDWLFVPMDLPAVRLSEWS